MKDELLQRLESFEIDITGAAFPFGARLARENGWSRDFATRVVAEYKRFVWLAMRAGHPVTPSQEVDEAWHLHLIYTRSYWDGMCREILGQPFHHGPTEGGKAEDAKFVDWYEKTLASYRRFFGEEPPADIWPSSTRRFTKLLPSPAKPLDHWRVPKRWVKYLGLAAIAPALAGCTRLLGLADASGFLCFGFAFVVIAAAVALAKRGGGGRCGGGGGGCGSHVMHHGDSSGGHCDGGSSGGCGSSSCGSTGCGSSGGSSGCGGGGGGGCGGGSGC